MRFFRRTRLLPGVSLNWSMGGPSLSFGPRGAKVTVGKRGVRTTVGVPGTGLYYTKSHGGGGQGRRRAANGEEGLPFESKLKKGFFERLFMPAQDKVFLDALRAYHEGRHDEALTGFLNCGQKADAMYISGVLYMAKGDNRNASAQLAKAYKRKGALNADFGKHGFKIECSVSITEHVTVYVYVRPRGVTLLLAESKQRMGRYKEAERLLQELLAEHSRDAVVMLAYIDVLLCQAKGGGDKALFKRIVEVTKQVTNEDEVCAALLHAKGQALCGLGMHELGAKTFSLALRRKKDRGEDLLNTIRYDRALAYQELGQDAKANKDFNAIYLSDPAFEDIEKRLGL